MTNGPKSCICIQPLNVKLPACNGRMVALLVSRSLEKCFSVGPRTKSGSGRPGSHGHSLRPVPADSRYLQLHPGGKAILDFHVDEPQLILDQGFHVKRVHIAES
jgi:hypothetical protein